MYRLLAAATWQIWNCDASPSSSIGNTQHGLGTLYTSQATRTLLTMAAFREQLVLRCGIRHTSDPLPLLAGDHQMRIDYRTIALAACVTALWARRSHLR